MNNRLQQTGSNLAEVLILVAVLVLVNWLGYKFFKRFDLTQNKQYTVSASTKKVLGSLEDPVNVTVYMSSELPPQIAPVKRILRDMLDEYAVYGKGRFRVRYVDPKDDQKLKDKAQNEGIEEVELNVMERDQMLSKKIFLGLVMSYREKSEVLRTQDLAQQGALEYALTSRVIKLAMDKKPRIGVFEGSFVANKQGQAPTYQFVQQLLGGAEGLYEIVRINPQVDKVLPDDLNGVVLLGTFGLAETMKYSIDQYLLQGGQVLVAIDPMMDLSQAGGGLDKAYPSLPSYEPELEKYGVKLEKKLVVETDPAASAQIGVPRGIFTLYQQYPLIPKAGPRSFNSKVAAVSRLESLVIPFCCPLFPVEVEGVEYQPLVNTTQDAFTISSPFDLNPTQDWRLLASQSTAKGPFTVGAMLSGKFPTAFPDGPPATPPPPSDAAGEGEQPPSAPLFNPAEQVKEGIGEGRLLVLSSANALTDRFMQQFQENSLFLANAVDMLAFGDDLLGIRSTPVTSRPLKKLSDADKQVYRWLNVLGIPVLLCLFGLAIWLRKGRRRAALQAKYSGAA